MAVVKPSAKTLGFGVQGVGIEGLKRGFRVFRFCFGGFLWACT